jgi:hypothetical protein
MKEKSPTQFELDLAAYNEGKLNWHLFQWVMHLYTQWVID